MAQTSSKPARTESAHDWDAIIIGSGMGGMSAGAALARTGHKVLILEQYQALGGLTHSFSREGFSWDVGIHYLSGFAPGEPERRLLDWISETPIELAPMGAIYDVLHLGNAEPLKLSRPFEAQILDLKERFPGESRAIDDWFEAVHKGQAVAMTMLQIRGMPEPFASMLQWWKRREIELWCERTTAEVAAEITSNPELTAAFLAQWGDHGGQPSKASFAVHALISYSYLDCGAWYPVGGASTIAEHILPVVTSAGGEARAGVGVDAVLMEKGRAVGVRTSDGEEIRGGAVISTIGARETVDRLLPDNCGMDDWVQEIRSLAPSISHFTLFLGFEGDIERAGATKANHWLYPTGETDAIWENAPEGAPPGMFVSFASLKDPAHDPGPRKKHMGELLAWTDWSTVESWAEIPPKDRGDDYAKFKQDVEAKLFDQFRNYFPELAKLVVFKELATPISTVAITGHRRGAFYGLDVTPKRMLSDALRVKTPIDGLYLAGQDAATPGVPGAMWGGLLCAGSIEPKVWMHLKA